MSSLVFYAAVCTDVGNTRSNNEDNFNILGNTLHERDYYGRYFERSQVVREGVVGVFDGMGGAANGEVASMAAAQYLNTCTEELLRLDRRGCEHFIQQANDAICANMRSSHDRMGTTAVIAAIRDGACTIANVGDSRIYLLSDGKLRQLSVDHTVSEQMVQLGMLTPEAARTDFRRHQLTQHLGILAEEMVIQPHVVERIPLQTGDRLLLCSDGVTEGLSDDDLLTLLSQDTSCEKMAKGIVESAMNGGSADNVTALVVKIGYPKPDQMGVQNAYTSDMESTITMEPPAQQRESYARSAPEPTTAYFEEPEADDPQIARVLSAVILILCEISSFVLGGIASILLNT